jgi:hypothetical protein
MLAYGVSEQYARQAAESAQVRIIEWRHGVGHSVRFRLGLLPSKQWQRLSASYFGRGRKVSAVCWHGHRDFFRALFVLQPDCRIQTAQTKQFRRGERFYTAENFERVFRETDKNIGPPIAPIPYSACCVCSE